jgi:putative membrane protein
VIHRFRDHAANERTYLAWVRTVLALAGFGILIDRLAPPGTTAT